MFEFITKYIKRHYNFDTVFSFGESQPIEPPPPTAISSIVLLYRRIILFFLQIIPWLCIGGFLLSLFYDFTDQNSITILGRTYPLKNLLNTLSISGLIGFGTNWIAIQMLFRPRKRRPIWGQGLIPANKEKIAERLASIINNNILNEEEIKQRIHESGIITRLNTTLITGTTNLLNDPEFQGEVKAFVNRFMTDFFSNRVNREKIVEELDRKLHDAAPKGFSGVVFRSYLVFNREKYLKTLDKSISEFPYTINKFMGNFSRYSDKINQEIVAGSPKLEEFLTLILRDLIDRIQIYQILRSQRELLDEGKLEQMIWKATNEQLLYIEYLGGWLGVWGGLLIWQPELMLIVFGIVLGFLYVLDMLLFRILPKPTR